MENEKLVAEVAQTVVPAGAKVFNFDAFDTKTLADAGVEVEILNASGDSTGVFITVLGVDSNQYQKMRERFDRARIKQMQKNNRNVVDSLYDNAKQHDLEMTAECTIAWRHVSQQMPFDVSDKEQLISFYSSYPLVYDQVRTSMNDRVNFTKGSVKA